MAGLFTFGCVGLLIWILPLGPARADLQILLWGTLALFGWAYYVLLDEPAPQKQVSIALVLLMSVTTIVVLRLTEAGVGTVLLMISAAAIAHSLPLRAAVLIMLGQNIATLPILRASDLNLLEALLMVAMYLGCSVFVFMTAWIARRQAQAREQLQQVNLELRAAQALLSDTERTAERLRISRELHDLVGHHLTALALNLEVATHLTEGKAKTHVQQAQSISKLLLADVREVVSTLREGDPTQLDRSLKMLVDGIPKPQVHLHAPEPFTVSDAPRAHVLLRLAQEILTNAIKHSGAKNIWLRFNLVGDGVEISAHDDGRGTNDMRAGNGLSGMRERLQAFGGTLLCESQLGRGFNVAAFLPLEKKNGTSTQLSQSPTFEASHDSRLLS
jgi:signal transduction histidine kinase